DAGQLLVSVGVGYAEQVAPIVRTRVGPCQRGRGGLVHEPEVAGVAAISTTECFRGVLQQYNRSARFASGDDRRTAGIPAAHNQNIARFDHVRCSKGRSSRISFTLSSASTLLMRVVPFAAPRTEPIKSRALATTSSRLIGFSAVPRTASTRSLASVPSVKVTSTMATRLGSSFSRSASGTS